MPCTEADTRARPLQPRNEVPPEACGCAVGLLALTPCDYIRSTHFPLQWAHRPGARYAPCARCQLSHGRLRSPSCLRLGVERTGVARGTVRRKQTGQNVTPGPSHSNLIATDLIDGPRRRACPARDDPWRLAQRPEPHTAAPPVLRHVYRVVPATKIANLECGEACTTPLVPGSGVAATACHASWRRRHARCAVSGPRAPLVLSGSRSLAESRPGCGARAGVDCAAS